MQGPWGFLKAPTATDIKGKRKRHKAFDPPPKAFQYLCVVDLEWTADDRPRTVPLLPEVIEIGAVLLRSQPFLLR